MIKIGTFVGNGAAQNISIGFVPEHVRIVNITDGNVIHEWFDGMGAGTAIKHTSGALATLATNGVSPFAGTSTAALGFTVGTDVSVNGKTLRYEATRHGPGMGA